MADLVQGIYIGWRISDGALGSIAAQMGLVGLLPTDSIQNFAEDVAAEIGAQVRLPVYGQTWGEQILISVFQPSPCEMLEFAAFAQSSLRLEGFLRDLGVQVMPTIGVDQREIN